MKDLGHGANVEQIARMYNKNPKDIIDFSSNINPNVIQGLEEHILEGLQESRSYPDIKYTKVNVSMYKGLNLFFDISYYNKLFIENNDKMGEQGGFH